MHKYKFVFIHPTEGTPNDNWFPWLKNQLELLGQKTIFMPQFPTPKGQNLTNWLKVYQELKLPLDEDTILIGHSIGAAFIPSLLEHANLTKPIKAAFIIAGFAKKLNLDFDNLLDSFVVKDYDWKKIKSSAQSFIMINADNDPYIPLDIANDMAANLGIKLNVVANGQHLTINNGGYHEFPFLLEKIKTIL